MQLLMTNHSQSLTTIVPVDKKLTSYKKMEINSFPLEEVPELVLLCIARHLPTDDARNLSMTCQKFKNILPTYPNPLIIKGPNFDERQHHSDWHFTPKKYFQSPILESRVERIDMKMKWKDQVCNDF